VTLYLLTQHPASSLQTNGNDLGSFTSVTLRHRLNYLAVLDLHPLHVLHRPMLKVV